MRYRYYTADVFTDKVFGGNPLAVFPDAEGLSPEQMQRVARELNLSETVFVRPPKHAANCRHLRIYTPAMELPFAGHPTLGCAHVLTLLGEIEARNSETEVVFEEGIGPITVRVQADQGKPSFTQLDIAKMPEFAMEMPSLRSIASALSLDISDLLLGDDRPVAVSCGVPFLVVPLRDLDSLGRARLDRETWESSLQDTWAPNLYAFVYGAETEGADLRARVFAPALGVEEDPATGAGAACLAGYLCSLEAKGQGSRYWTVEQGYEMGRPSLIKLEADMEQGAVTAIRVGGASVLVGEAWIEVPEPGEPGGLVLDTSAEAKSKTDGNGKPEAKPEDKPKEKAPEAKPEADKAAETTATQSTKYKQDKPEAEAKPEPKTKDESKTEAEAKPEPESRPEARSEPEKASADGAPAKAKSDKVVPLRAVLEALTAKKGETAAADKNAAKPELVRSETAKTGTGAEADAEASEDTPDKASDASSERRIGFVMDHPGSQGSKKQDTSGSGLEPERSGERRDQANAGKATNGKDSSAQAYPGEDEDLAEDGLEDSENDFEDTARGFDDEDDRSWDDDLEDEAEDDDLEDDEDWDDEERVGDELDEDLRRFRRQEHYKFLWSATLRHGDQIYACVIIDLSPKAALLQLEEELAYDLTLNFDSPVTLKNDKIGRLKGEVAWRDKNRLGVELLEDPEDVSKILDAARN